MGLVLDASAALAWIFNRTDPAEAQIASDLLIELRTQNAVVPTLWFAEVSNGILVAERRGLCDAAKSAYFLSRLSGLQIAEDTVKASGLRDPVLALGRAHSLTAYDATYLELALRSGRTLATFDRRLAEAARASGVKVFGDPA